MTEARDDHCQTCGALVVRVVSSSHEPSRQPTGIDRAITTLEAELAQDPRDLRARLKLADLYAKAGRVAHSTDAFWTVADEYRKLGFQLKAVAVYKQILKRDPTSAETRRRLAEVYRFLGLVDEAQEQERYLSEDV